MVNTKNPFEDKLNNDIKSYWNELSWFENKISKVRDKEWKAKNKIITDKNAKYQELSKWYKNDLQNIKSNAENNIATRRNESNQIVKDKEQNAGREAMIQSENASRAGKMSTNAISKLNSDITARFSDQLANAKKDNLKFQTQMDDKIKNLWFTVQDKQRIIDNFTKSMDTEAAAPLLASITAKANTKEEFTKMLSQVVTDLRKKTLNESNNRSNKQKKLIENQDAFKQMDPSAKRAFALDKIWSLINIDPGVKNKLVSDVLNWNISYPDFIEQSYALKDKSDSIEWQKQTLTWSYLKWNINDSVWGRVYNQWLNKDVSTTTTKADTNPTNNYLDYKRTDTSPENNYWNTIQTINPVSTPKQNVTRPKAPSTPRRTVSTPKAPSTPSTPKVTYMTRAQAIKVNSTLKNLKTTNPAKYKQAVNKLRTAVSNGTLKYK